ncbi:MAG: hypothetical protein II349_02785 [Akkermansia sp.]|nr:hypothetical protein [Akkermansia sp.]
MKKTVAIIAIVCVSALGFCMGTSTAAEVVDTKSFDAQANMRCTLCKGSGFQSPTSPFACPWCKGSGRNNSY